MQNYTRYIIRGHEYDTHLSSSHARDFFLFFAPAPFRNPGSIQRIYEW